MKKIFFLVFALLSLSACGKYENENVSVSDLASALAYEADLEEESPQNLKSVQVGSLYGISPDEIEEGIVYKDDDDSDIVVVVKAKNYDFLRNAEMAFETKVNEIKNAWKYDIEESKKIDNHLLKSRGMYTVMVVAEDINRVERTFNNMVTNQ